MSPSEFNKKLQKKGYKVQIVRGEGYYYWVGDGVENLMDASVMVPYFYMLSDNTWFKLADEIEMKLAELEDEEGV